MVRALGTRLVRLSLLSASVSAIAATAAPHAAHAQAVRSFDIPAQPLSSAILEFSRQSDVMIVVAPEATDGKRSKPLRATLPVNEAIAQLLKGTGLRAVANPAGGYSVGRESAQLRQGDAASFPLEEVRAVRAAEEEGPTIIVTGTRLATPGVSSPVPLTAIKIEELPSADSVGLGDALDRLPALRSTFNQTNSGSLARVGQSGLNILDLRGLGTVRTLVLVNGRRHVSSIPGEFAVDVNTIPDELVERVDIVTGGNSAIYGSDAVAGVVNFITKRDFEGLDARVLGGITSRGDRGQYRLSLTGGKNFAGGRGNVAVSLAYSHADTLVAEDRDYLTGYYSGAKRFQLTEPIAGEPAAGDGIPDYAFYEGVRSNSSTGGTVTAVCGAANLGNDARCTPAGYARYYMFLPNGTLAPNNPTLDFRDITNGANTSTVGGLGYSEVFTGNLAPGVDRYSANLIAHYDVSDAFKPFIEAKYVHITANAAGQPSFFNGSLASWAAFSGGVPANNFRCNNPFLQAQALTTLQSAGLCADVDNGTFTMNRFNMDLGERQEREKRDIYRIVGGAQGDFNEDWRYEVAFNYGRFDSTMTSVNSLYTPNFLRAIDAVRNTAGNIVCRVNADSDSGNDDPACVPLNIFGRGASSPEALAYINRSTVRTLRTSQFTASAYIAGDTSQLFELPGGPVGFVIGGEYRRETASAVYDAIGTEAFLFGPGGPPFEPPAQKVKEVFGELSLPLLKDVPFAETLAFSASGRISDYNGKAGTVYAYNLGGVYAPVRDVRFRVNYSQSVRAPTLGNLYAAEASAPANVRDPCDILYINSGSSTRAANCRAAGLPADFENTIARRQTISGISGGNPDLDVETARSWTIGTVLMPRFIPGLTFTADYYQIDIKDMIAAVSAQAILDNCYDAATLSNPYCGLITRGPDGLFAIPGIRVSTVNFARQKTRGLDMELNYVRTFDNGHRLSFKALATHVFELNNYTNPADPTAPNRQLSELGDPRWAANLNVSYGIGPLTLGYQLQYIGKQTIGLYESQHSFNGNPPTNADEYADPWYPDVFYHNFRVSMDVGTSFTLYGGVDNAFDRKPPYSIIPGFAGAIYDAFGRSFYMGARAKF